MPPPQEQPDGEGETPDAFEITATLTVEEIDAWWSRLDYASKANVIAANFNLGL